MENKTQKELMQDFHSGAKVKIESYQEKAGMSYKEIFKEFFVRIQNIKDIKKYSKILNDIVAEANISLKEVYHWIILDRIVNELPNGKYYCIMEQEEIYKGKCFNCQFGHLALDCHFPYSCHSEYCNHYRFQWNEDYTLEDIEKPLKEEY